MGRQRARRPVSRRRLRLTGLLGSLVLTATLVLGVSPAVDAAPSSELQRYPYLTDLVGGSVTVNWATVDTGSTTGTVTWGPAGGSCTENTANATRISISINGLNRWQWQASITGLAADTEYCYRVFKGATDLLASDASPIFRSHVAAGSSSPYSFVVFGDWGLGSASGNSHQTNLFQRIAQSGARFALSTGDVPYGSGSAQTLYGDLSYAASGVFGTTGWPVAGKSIAMFNALGNHGRNVSHLQNWPSTTAASTSGGRYQLDSYPSMNGTDAATYPSAWYAFDAGQIRFYVLDTSWSNGNNGTLSGSTSEKLYKNDYDQHWQPGSAEYEWLKADLAANQGKAKIAVHHFPLWSANPNESSDTYLQGASSLEGLLTSNGVKLSFSGHAHHYERNKPSALGLTTYISGAGGADLHSIKCTTEYEAFTGYAIAWSGSNNVGSKCPSSVPTPTSANQVYHFIKVTVSGTTVTLTPTNEDGVTFDEQTFDLAPSSEPPPPEPPPSANIAFVRQATAGVTSGTTLRIPVQSTSAGDTLISSIAQYTGSSRSITAVTDNVGGGWTRGPVGYLSGSNTRIELWYRTNVPAGITSVTATQSASGVAAANVSEWSGVVSVAPVDRQASRGNASSTSPSTPSITTTNADDVVIGAINYPGSASSTLASAAFTPLNEFDAGSANGRAAYRIVSATGTYQASWTLSTAATSGAAILALKGSAEAPSDTTDPTVSLTAPPDGSTVGGTVELAATASDDVGVVGVQFQVDGAAVGAEDTTAPYTAGWDTSGLANGSTHAISAVARDAAGNTATSASVTVTVDNTPEPDTVAPSAPQGLTAQAAGTNAIDLAWQASTDDVGVAGYRIYRDGAATPTASVAGASTTSYRDTGLAAGSSHTYRVTAVDASGNESAPSNEASATTASGGGEPQTVTLTPTADSYVAADSTSTNYGTRTSLRVDGSPVTRTYLRFDLTALSGTVTNAVLRVRATSSLSAGYSVFPLADPTATWTETGITYANAPAPSTTAAGSSGPVTSNTWIEIDVTSLAATGRSLSLVLATTSSTALALASRESGAYAPQLVVTTSGVVAETRAIPLRAAKTIL